MDLILIQTMDAWPPTVNHMTGHGNGHAWDTEDYREFKERFAYCFFQPPDLSRLANRAFSLEVDFYWHGWFKKDGSLYPKRDVSNRYKAVEDAVFRAVGLDDYVNCRPLMWKRRPLKREKEPYIKIRLWMLTDDEYRKEILGNG